MKRILFACFLATAVCTLGSVERASAQAVHVTAAAFTAKVNLLDSYIGSGNLTAANATWDSVHHMMMNVLAWSKKSIQDAPAATEQATYKAILSNQISIYKATVPFRFDLVTNRTALHTKLGEFDLTIY